MVHVTQVILLALEKDHCQAIQSQGTADIVVQNPSTQVEPLVILASLCELALFLVELSHLEIYMRFFHEVTLLDACLSLHDQVLWSVTTRTRHTAWPRTERNGRCVMVLSLIAKTNVAQRVLHDTLENVRGLHSDLLREAAVSRCRVSAQHVEFVRNHLKDVKFFDLKVA